MEGDICACFDKIEHKWLLNNVPMDRKMLRKWLSAGYIFDGKFQSTNEGTPQGGMISLTLLTVRLAGLEKSIKAVTKPRDKVNLVTYADDFIITGSTKKILEETFKPAVEKFIRERGLELSDEKTLTTHIDNEFDFLGFNIRKYRGKLLKKPAKKSVKAFLNDVRTIIKKHAVVKTEKLIFLLNPKIKGWENYYRHGVSSKTFATVDCFIFQALRRWANGRHHNKSPTSIDKKYFCTMGNENWVFNAGMQFVAGSYRLVHRCKASATKIVRHVKIIADANPYDPKYTNYLEKRKFSKAKSDKMDNKSNF